MRWAALWVAAACVLAGLATVPAVPTADDASAGEAELVNTGLKAAVTVGAGSPVGPDNVSHGWLVVERERSAEARWGLYHVGPREALVGPMGPVRGSTPGLVRTVVPLVEKPSALAASGDAVFAIFAPGTGGSGDAEAEDAEGDSPTTSRRPVRVLAARALADAVARWRFEPGDGLETLPALSTGDAAGSAGGGALGIAARSGESGPEVLVLTAGDQAPRLRWLRLSGPGARVWREVSLPDEVLAAWREGALAEELRLTGSGVPVLMVRRGGGVRLWWLDGLEGTEPAAGESRDALRGRGLTGRWRDEAWVLPGEERSSEAGGGMAGWAAAAMAVVGRRVVLIAREGGVVAVGEVVAGGVGGPADGGAAVRLVGRVEGVAGEVSAAVCGGSGARVVLTWPEVADGPAMPGRSLIAHEVVELSLVDGGEMFRGAAVRASPVSPAEFQVLSLVLVVLLVVVLVVIVKPGGEAGVAALPAGYALAEPGRRVVGALVDVCVASLVAGAVMGVSPVEILTLRVMLEPSVGWWSVGWLVGAGWVMGTVLEWRTGRSLGKWLTGTRVVSVRGGGAGVGLGVGLGASAGRNAVKWLVPPVAMLGVLDGAGRHRGDQFARAAVVSRVEAEAGEGA